MKQLTGDEHLFGPGPKRMLSLDGGGIRGTLSLEFLKRIEGLLRARYGGDPEFRLCDYFDLIGGNSTGAIIAGALALGFSVERLQALYRELGDGIFKRPPLRLGLIAPKFPKEPLANALAEAYGDATLGGEAVRTGIMIALKRVDTGSPWMVHNNPRGKFFAAGGGATPNRDFLLRQVVYASAAAPHYFEPERIEVAPGVDGVFIDGGVAAALNPALHTLMLATLDGYGLRWPLGAENLLLVSVGAGVTVTEMTADEAMRVPALPSAVNAMFSALNDMDWLVQTVLQWMSDSPTRWQADGEIGDLAGDRLAERPLLSYLRYNAVFESGWLREQLGLVVDKAQADSLVPMDNAKSIELLAQIGRLAAAKQVREDHFPAAFDLTPQF
jgi:uncharacterized protein